MKRDLQVSRIALWILLYGVLLGQTYRYLSGTVFYGEYVHWTGLHATHLLLIVMAITPLRRVLPHVGFVRWLVANRRDIGVAVFGYASAHTLAYLYRHLGLAEIIDDAGTVGILAGWLALLVFLPLALTSNDYSVRTLKGRWKSLHRIVYVGALLTIVHWVLTAFDPTTSYVYLAVLFVLFGLRAVWSFGAKSTSS